MTKAPAGSVVEIAAPAEPLAEPPGPDDPFARDPRWNGRHLGRGRRIARACLAAAVLALPVLLVADTPPLGRAFGLALAGLAFLGILGIRGRSTESVPPPVYEWVYVTVLMTELVVFLGFDLMDRGRTPPLIYARLVEPLSVPVIGPLWWSGEVPAEFAAIHAAAIAVALPLTLAGAAHLLLSRWPRPGQLTWARAWAAHRREELGRMRQQRIWGTGTLRNLVLAGVGLYFPIKPAYFTEAMVLPGFISIDLGIALLFILKAAVMSLVGLIAVATVKLALTERAISAGRRTGRGVVYRGLSSPLAER